jgi:class 3 adenylate cyclase
VDERGERVECLACGVENASTRKFCRACGARLPLRCIGCETLNEPDDRFCGECGAPLTGAVAGPSPAATRSTAVPPVAAVPPAAGPAEERRQVTVLFADLVGFTSLAERLDAEDVRDMTTDCLRQLAAEAVRFEGTVDKLIGDAVMILFGAPVAHEDDPARALRASLAMQRALDRFNEALERTHGLSLRLRIGVETGEVVAGPREVGGMVEYTVIGDAVNVASRLQTAAAPGAILVGEGTSGRIDGGFHLQAVEPLTLKGRERPVAAAILLAEAADEALSESRIPLVGRGAELRALLDRLDALRAGRGGAIVVVGAPGLGKSRLLAELRAQVSDGDTPLLWVRCQAFAHEQAQSYGLARSLVRALLGISAEERDPIALVQLRTAFTALGLAGVEAPLIRLLGLSVGERDPLDSPVVESGAEGEALRMLAPPDLQRRLFDAVVALVDRLAARRPLVLELDDLHWADPISIDLLLELVDRAGRSPLLLCCAFRPELDAACQALRERAQWRLGEQYAEIALRPLSEAASAELAARLLGRAETLADGPDDEAPTLPTALRSFLERAAGTPLWLEELVRTLVERGVLVESEDGWQIIGDLDAVELPSSLQALIVARIDRLGPARPTLQVASVIGRRFGRNVLEHVAEAAGRLDDDLSQAQRADLVRELPAHLEREYDFKHVLVRDAAYATLLHRRRRALHRRVAETVEQLYPERVPELHAVLAYHYERAEVWRRACEHARAAAESARDGCANREAIESYTLALRMADRAGFDPSEHGALFEGRGAVHERVGDFESARGDYETALTLAGPADATTRIRLLGALGPIGRVRRARGDLAGALADHQEMLAIARDVGSAVWTVEALANVAFGQLALGSLEAARVASNEAIALGGQYQKGTLDAWLTRVHLLLLDGHPSEALAEIRATRALIAEFRVRLPELIVLEGAALAALDQPDAAGAAFQEALDVARSVGAAVGLWQAGRALADLLVSRGRVEEAGVQLGALDAELDVLARDLDEPTLGQVLAARRWPSSH